MRLYQHTYIERILKRFNMQSCSSDKASIVRVTDFPKANVFKMILREIR